MTRVLLIQLPIPRLNYGKKTGNIPLGAACLKQAAAGIQDMDIEILPESVASYLGDGALKDLIIEKKPDIVGFTLFNWNVERSLALAEEIKKQHACRIIVGGPEITPDNTLIRTAAVDTFVFGDGEQAFITILSSLDGSIGKELSSCSESIFMTASSPYIEGLLEPHIENLILLETQRGCPYRCGFCFYNKSRSTLSFKDEKHLLEGVRWAVDYGIEELYLLDPSLNARPDLKNVLSKIAEINVKKRVSITSEIRAEWIDEELADLFLKAGFSGFEIGLQTTNKRALSVMKRPTDLKKFLKGSLLLKERDILPRIDLIAGLPGDDLEGFKRSIGFISENNLNDDVQVFPLSILPGTSFRKNSKKLNLIYEPSPPYTVIETDTYSKEDLLLSFDYAESLFDVALFPLPELNVSWKRKKPEYKGDVWVNVGKEKFLAKLVLDSYRSLEEVESLAKKLTFPYQIYVDSNVTDSDYLAKVLEKVTDINPFTPLELVFIEPRTMPDDKKLLSHVRLKRPHYLDHDLRYLYSKEGNRSVLFTVISRSTQPVFTGDMKRQIYYWTEERLPEPEELDELGDFEGIIIDNNIPDTKIRDWQDHFAPSANYIPQISFARMDRQLCWLELTLGDEYYMRGLE
ncbi:MAG: radical SAM protein [Desulfobacteraceae bacterium]|jgi:radical SAM superfamily enzyme YgiQ (UPF0313 family)